MPHEHPGPAQTPTPRSLDDARSDREQRYAHYIAAFNQGDLAAVRDFLSAGFTFDRGDWPHLHSPDEFVSFYEEAWTHFDERIRPLSARWEEFLFVVDLEVALHVTSDWEDFPGGPLRRGETFTVEDRLSYRFDDDDRIRHIAALPREAAGDDGADFA